MTGVASSELPQASSSGDNARGELPSSPLNKGTSNSPGGAAHSTRAEDFASEGPGSEGQDALSNGTLPAGATGSLLGRLGSRAWQRVSRSRAVDRGGAQVAAPGSASSASELAEGGLEEGGGGWGGFVKDGAEEVLVECCSDFAAASSPVTMRLRRVRLLGLEGAGKTSLYCALLGEGGATTGSIDGGVLPDMDWREGVEGGVGYIDAAGVNLQDLPSEARALRDELAASTLGRQVDLLVVVHNLAHKIPRLRQRHVSRSHTLSLRDHPSFLHSLSHRLPLFLAPRLPPGMGLIGRSLRRGQLEGEAQDESQVHAPGSSVHASGSDVRSPPSSRELLQMQAPPKILARPAARWRRKTNHEHGHGVRVAAAGGSGAGAAAGASTELHLPAVTLQAGPGRKADREKREPEGQLGETGNAGASKTLTKSESSEFAASKAGNAAELAESTHRSDSHVHGSSSSRGGGRGVRGVGRAVQVSAENPARHPPPPPAPPALKPLLDEARLAGIPVVLAITNKYAASSERRHLAVASVMETYGIPPSATVVVNSRPFAVAGAAAAQESANDMAKAAAAAQPQDPSLRMGGGGEGGEGGGGASNEPWGSLQGAGAAARMLLQAPMALVQFPFRRRETLLPQEGVRELRSLVHSVLLQHEPLALQETASAARAREEAAAHARAEEDVRWRLWSGPRPPGGKAGAAAAGAAMGASVGAAVALLMAISKGSRL
eukprot:jgi/Mesen1/447/ME000101S10674